MTSAERTAPIDSEQRRGWRWVWAAPVAVAVLLAAWAEKPILGGLLAAAGGLLVPLIWGRLVSGLRTMVAEVAATGRLRRLGERLVWAVLLPAARLGALAVTAGLGKWLLEDRDIMRWCVAAGVGLGTLVTVLRSAWQAGRASGGNVHRDASPVLIAAVLAAYVVTWTVATRWFTGPEFVLHAAVVAAAYMLGQAASLLCWRRFMFAADALAAPLALTAAAVSYLAHDMGRSLFQDDAWSSLLAALLAFLLAWPVGHLAAVAIWGAMGWVARSLPWIAPSRRLPFAWREVAWCPAAPARAAAGKRRPFQFRLRTLLVVTIVLGLLSGWVGRYVKRARDQQAAVDAILELGGMVIYEDGRSAGDRFAGLAIRIGPGPGPKWARDLLGENFFARVASVDYPREAGDGDLVQLEKLRGLKSLDLSCAQITDAGLAEVAKARDLETLILWATPVTDQGMSHLAKLRHLRELHLGATDVGDAGVAELAGLERLETLGLSFTPVTDASVEALLRMPRLKELDLYDTRVSSDGERRLQRARAWKTLGYTEAASEAHRQAAIALARMGHFVWYYFDDDKGRLCREVILFGEDRDDNKRALDLLAQLRGLTDLSLRGMQLRNNGPDCLEHLTELRELSINDATVVDRDLAPLARMTKLEDLYLDCPKATDAALAHLAGLTHLELLCLTCPNLTDAGLEHLQRLGNLRVLVISGASMTGSGLVHLPNAEGLENLRLEGCAVTDAGLAHVAQMKNLTNLDLNGTRMTDAGLAHLSGLKKLRSLSLNGTAIKGPGLAHLEGLTQLGELSLEGTQVTPAAVQKLEAALPDTAVYSDVCVPPRAPLPPASNPPPEEPGEELPK